MPRDDPRNASVPVTGMHLADGQVQVVRTREPSVAPCAASGDQETTSSSRLAFLVLLLGSILLWGCGDSGPTLGGPPPYEGEFPCVVPTDSLFDGGVGRDGIRALVDPPLVSADDPDASYVRPGDRVVGVRAGEGYVAIPHNILFRHETVNLEVQGHPIAVTYCPLTGSYAVFDREPIDGVDLGISGILFRSNLVVFDRREDGSAESIWSQMDGRSICGRARGRLHPVREEGSISPLSTGWSWTSPSRRMDGRTNRRGACGIWPARP